MRDTQSAGAAAPPSQGHAAFAGLRQPRAGTLAASYAGLNTHYVADAFLNAALPPGERLRTTTSSIEKNARAATGLRNPFGPPTAAEADGRHRRTHCAPSSIAQPNQAKQTNKTMTIKTSANKSSKTSAQKNRTSRSGCPRTGTIDAPSHRTGQPREEQRRRRRSPSPAGQRKT